MLFKNKKVENKMYLGSCNVLNLKNGNYTHVGDILFKNKKDAETWMKNIRENYIKDGNGNIQKNWKTVDYLCYKNKERDCEYYTVKEIEEDEFGNRTMHELWYRPIEFAKI